MDCQSDWGDHSIRSETDAKRAWAQYQREEINQVAQVVAQKLEALVAEVTTEGGA